MASPVNPSVAVWRKRVTAYAFALVITGLVLQIRLILNSWLGDQPMVILFMLPIIASAYVGGVGPGLVATALSAAGIYYFVLAKANNLFFFEGSISLWQWVILMVSGGMVSVLVEALHRSRKRIESTGNLQSVTLASIGDAVITTDSDGRVTFLNGEAERLTQWSNTEAQGLPLPQVFRIINEETRAPVEDPVLKVLRTGTVAGLANHTVLVGRHGSETAIDDSGAPIKESDGHIAGVVLVFRDCTESKKAAEALRNSQALYHSLVEQMPAGIFRKDAAGRYVFVNPTFCRLRGVTPGMFLGKLPGELPDSETTPRNQGAEHHERIMRTGEAVEVQEEHHRDDGTTVFFHVVKTPVFDANGRITGSQGVLFDATERVKEQDALARSVSLLQATIEASSDGMLVVDTAGHVTVYNNRLLEIFKIPKDLMAQGDDRTVLKRAAEQMADPEEFFRRVQAHYASPKKSSFDLLALRDGRVIERLSHPQRLGEKIIGRVWSFRDITEKKLAEEKFAREQARFKLIFDTVPIGIAFHTIHPDGTTTRIINDAHLHIAGLTRSQDGEPGIYRKITHPDDYALQAHFKNKIKAGQGKQFSIEKRYLHPDGKVVWVTFSYQQEIYPDGTVVELTTVVDITERKAAEQQSRQLAVIVESSEDAIIGKDLNGIITTWNRGAETIFGYAADEIVGRSVLELYPADAKAEETSILARIARGENVEHFQTDRVRKDGKRIRISATISPLRDSQGHVVGAAAIARDITRQQMLEEQLRQSQKMEAIGQLAGGVAHDFNNILAVIQMQLELSKMDGGLAPAQAGCLDEIQVAACRGANLTRQLLLFSRRQRLQPRELDLSDSITGMTKMLLRVLGEDIQIQFKYAPQPLFIRADAVMMDQILMNLTLNSRDAMPDGGQLTIETAAVEIDELAAAQSAQARPGSFVRLSVRDTGCGIAPEILPRIFEPFFTTKDVGKGTGLGLATVFSIVQQHQGWINVTSQPGSGTTFDIYLPRLAGVSPEPAETVSLAAAVGGTETILLVEDDDALRAAVYRCLSQLGYRLIEAANGAAALKVWQAHRDEVRLLLTDLVMPGGVSGKDLGERLRRENPKLQVIYVSGYSPEVFAREFSLASDVTFLAKPFPAQELARAVRASLDKK